MAGGTATGTAKATTAVGDTTVVTKILPNVTTQLLHGLQLVGYKYNSRVAATNVTKTTAVTKEETKTEEKTAIDYEKIYNDYVNDEIIKNIEGGLASS